MAEEKQPYKGNPSFRPNNTYGSIPYSPPERVEHYHEEPVEKVNTISKTTRIALSIFLSIIGIIQLVRVVLTIIQLANESAQDPTTSPVAGLAVILALLGLAGIFLAYPIVNILRWKKSVNSAKNLHATN